MKLLNSVVLLSHFMRLPIYLLYIALYSGVTDGYISTPFHSARSKQIRYSQYQ